MRLFLPSGSDEAVTRERGTRSSAALTMLLGKCDVATRASSNRPEPAVIANDYRYIDVT
jgi:hypothetical protein